ncbi:MAG TPA: efflux RND transporter periplasmic adaptor subunit [Cytophagaceae bacterium]|nr:efflux RND transporter periplasmic adaptor subunit [Cytophagaceae bacterium]
MKKIIVIMICMFFFSCSKQVEKLPDNVFYTCSMDPQVMEKKPGKCPICKMELTKVTIDKNSMSGLKLSEEQMELANIMLGKAEEGWIAEEKILNGLVVANGNNKTVISSRVSGRIEKLYFKSSGDLIREGDVLYEIYSEELLTAYKEYLLALEKEKQLGNSSIDYTPLKEAAKNKLLLWGLTETQLRKMNSSHELTTSFPIISKSKGVITNIDVKEGDYVMMGTDLFELADFSSVWIEAQLYSNELESFSYKDEVVVHIAGIPELQMKGKISLVLPELQPQSKIDLFRVELPNKDLVLKPGMQAYITLRSNSHKALLVNTSAVLQDSKGSFVWVRKQDGSFVIKMVEVGMQSNEMAEITAGLKEGDEVVVTGAYLINSEYIFKKGSDPMESHDM